jgi:hypothetical protein
MLNFIPNTPPLSMARVMPSKFNSNTTSENISLLHYPRALASVLCFQQEVGLTTADPLNSLPFSGSSIKSRL